MTAGDAPTRLDEAGGAQSSRFASWILWVAFGLLALRTLAVDVFPVITNDSLAYLGHSNSLLDTGLVQFGYRQVGYPLFLAAVDGLAGIVRLEPLLTGVVIQRLALVGALAYATWLWRFWALPLVFVLTTPTLVAYTNLVLTEGAGLPLAVLYGCLTAHTIRRSDRVDSERVDRIMLATMTAAGVVFLALVAIRFHYIVTAAGVAGCLWAVWFRGSARDRRIGVAIGAVVLVVGGTLLGIQSLENHREYGSAFPSARGERGLYWATWTMTFRSAENRSNPAVADLYADGDAYAFIRQTETELAEYPAQREAFIEAVDRLVTASGSSMWAARLDSAGGVLVGGRIDDVAAIVKEAARTSFGTVEASIYRTPWFDQNGREVFYERFTDGRTIAPIISSSIAPLRSAPYFVTFFRFLGPISLVVLAIGVAFRESRLLGSVGLITLVGTAAVMGYFLLDNVRFVLVPLVFTFAVATATAAALGPLLRRLVERPAQSPRLETADGAP